MRLGRLVAAGLVAGAVAGFVGALLRPRTVQDYRPDVDRPATDARGDLAAAQTLAVPQSRTLHPAATGDETAADPGAAPDPADDPADADPADGTARSRRRTLDVDAVPSDPPVAGAVVAAAPSPGANG